MALPLPSLNALRAFEAAARLLSFTKAAAELHVTQGAVSHQVKGLEDELGVKLFHRFPQRLILTNAGQAFLPVVSDAFQRLVKGTTQLRRAESSGALTVSVSPNFASKWLVHRLGTFASRYPDIDLRVSANLEQVDFAREDVDLAVRHGDGQWPELHVVRLCVEAVFPVCSPALLRGPRPLRAPADLRHHVLLREAHADWPAWLAEAGLTDIDPGRGPSFNQVSLAIDAAIEGQGVAMARSALAAADLLAGRLVRPFTIERPAPYAYWVVCPKATAERPKISAFRDWLLAEAATDAERLKGLATPAAALSPKRGRRRASVRA